jgi:murein L,D-transpeptidase YafK
MSRTRKNILFLIKFLTAVLLLSCISPAQEATAPIPAAFNDRFSTLSGKPRLIIWKSQYTVTLYRGDTPIKTYRAVFGKGFLEGDKRMEGDKRTPEGEFYICTMNRSKRFYKFLGLSYPDLKHAEYGLKSGIISLSDYVLIKRAIDERQTPPWDTRLGGAVGIHGRAPEGGAGRQSFIARNWTDGCIALDNADVDELFDTVSLGTPVTILP